MGSTLKPWRVVFDTNTVVSALLFSKGRLDWLRALWRQGDIIPLVSRATAEELIRVLAYPKFRLSPSEREELLGDFLPFSETVETPDPTDNLPVCRDQHDQKFLELAASAQADCLVTGDRDLMSLAEHFPIPILTAAELHRRLQNISPPEPER